MELARLEERLDHQDGVLDQLNKSLNEVLICIKGSEAMQIEGVLGKQKKLLAEQKRMEEKLDEEIRKINQWQNNIQKYFDILTSKGFRIFLIAICVMFLGVYILGKGGVVALKQFFVALGKILYGVFA